MVLPRVPTSSVGARLDRNKEGLKMWLSEASREYEYVGYGQDMRSIMRSEECALGEPTNIFSRTRPFATQKSNLLFTLPKTYQS